MSTVKVNNVQIGQSSTADNNFTLSVPVVPDGSFKIARGNVGATTQDIIAVATDGTVSLGNVEAVSTTGTQTLTNKTIAFNSNTLTDVASTNTTQTLTNKTISVDNNTVSGVAASSFVVSDASGNIDGAAAQKAIPTGAVVGTTDTQTLTNKTLSTGTVFEGGALAALHATALYF